MSRKPFWRGKRRSTAFVGRNVISLATKEDHRPSHGPAGPARSLITGEVFPISSVWRTIGADCPWNTTPGKRQVWHNGKLISATQMPKQTNE